MMERKDRLNYDIQDLDDTPQSYKLLFEPEEENLSKITETPSNMVVPFARLSVWRAAWDPNRVRSLDQVFETAYDERMISRDRQNRVEFVEIFKSQREQESRGDIAL